MGIQCCVRGGGSPLSSAGGCAELIALSLAYALPISSVLNGLLTASAETEMEMVAVERVLQYTSCLQVNSNLPQARNRGSRGVGPDAL